MCLVWITKLVLIFCQTGFVPSPIVFQKTPSFVQRKCSKLFAKLISYKVVCPIFETSFMCKWSICSRISYRNYKNVHTLTFNNLHNQCSWLFMWMISQNKIQFNSTAVIKNESFLQHWQMLLNLKGSHICERF